MQLGPEFMLLDMETIGPLGPDPMGPLGPIDMGGKGDMFMLADELGGLMSLGACEPSLGPWFGLLPPLSGNNICCILRIVANCSSRCARCCGVKFSSGIFTPAMSIKIKISVISHTTHTSS